MIEMPEATTIPSQMQTTLVDKTILRFARGSMTHKFLWLNRPDEEYQTILADKTAAVSGILSAFPGNEGILNILDVE